MSHQPKSITSLTDEKVWTFQGDGVLVTLARKSQGWTLTCDPYFHNTRLVSPDLETARVEALRLTWWAFDRARKSLRAELDTHIGKEG